MESDQKNADSNVIKPADQLAMEANSRFLAVLAKEKPIPASGAQRTRILFVEDHGSTGRVLTNLLRRMGHDVDWATDLTTARSLITAKQYDLLLSDLGLPDGRGTELMTEVRRRGNLPGIALTGYGMEKDIIASREAGFAEHLTKPVDLATLQSAISRVLASHAVQV